MLGTILHSHGTCAKAIQWRTNYYVSAMFYNYDSYCAMYEDVFAWILDAFDQLKAMEDLANDLETIKIQVNSKIFF